MEEKSPRSRFALLAYIAVIAFGTCYTVLFFILSIPRLLYPYEIEFFEGTALEHALRIFQGKPVFTSPSILFVNLQYQPLFYYATAGAMHIFGINYFSGRIVSFSSAIICAIIIFYIIHKETRLWIYSFVGVSLFFAAYGVTGYWYELARVDTLMLLFLLASIVSLLFWKNRFMIILSALFLVLGFFTKQQLFFYFVPAFIWLFILDKRSAIIFAASSLMFLTAGFCLFTLDSGRWYFYFTFTLPAALGAELHLDRMWGGLARYLFTYYAAGTLLLILFWIFVWQRGKNLWKNPVGLYILFAITAIVQLALQSAHSGSYNNVAMPLAAMMAIMIPTVSYYLLNRNDAMIRNFVLAAVLIQFGGLFYSFRSVPLAMITKKEYDAGAAFISELRSIPGNVFLPQHGFLSFMAGKQTFGNSDATEDCEIASDSTALRLHAEWQNAFALHRYDAIIIDDGPYRPFDSIPGYTFVREMNLGPNPFVTRNAGAKYIPRYVYLPKK